MHPGFGKKSVLRVLCRYCKNCVCNRGMKAVLLADTNVELYSTDAPLYERVSSIGKCYSTQKCSCKVLDIGCTTCGNAVGYHVELPCASCLQSCNNGHLWIFKNDAIQTEQRIDETGQDFLRWDRLPEDPDKDDIDGHDDFIDSLADIECCR